jgi:uncharacterized protein (TIGR00730 family)
LGNRPAFTRAAQETGAALVERGLGLVYGGGNIGLMGVIADAVLERGGEVIGVIPQALVDRELAHGGLSKLHIVQSMHARKALMADLAQAFVALPGGYGTMDELCEMLTWSQLGLHLKPCALLDVEGYFDPLVAQIEAAVNAGFIPQAHRKLLQVHSHPGELIDLLLSSGIAPDVRPPARTSSLKG